MTRYAIGLGSNLGDRIGHLRAADSGLASVGRIEARSSLYETLPVGGPEQGPYLNAVVLLDTDLSPEVLLAACHRIEAARGRERTERWGPRTLDVDLIAREGPPLSEESLVVPHPQAAEREFVLRPLAEVWPDARVGEGVTATRALGSISPQGVDRLVRRWADDTAVGGWLVVAQMALIVAAGLGLVADGSFDWDNRPLLRGVGLVLLVLGSVLGGSATASVGTAIRALPEPRPGAELVEGGVYSMVRHPMYGGLILVAVGASLALASVWGFVGSLALAAVLLVKSDYEERRLRIRFPAYAAYRRRVPRRLIPGLF